MAGGMVSRGGVRQGRENVLESKNRDDGLAMADKENTFHMACWTVLRVEHTLPTLSKTGDWCSATSHAVR